MNMSNPDGRSAKISPDEWERIARYVTGEAGPGEAEITRRWVQADSHRVEIVRLLESIVRNVDREDSSATAVDVESALSRVKARFGEAKVLPFSSPAGGDESRRSLIALLKVAAAGVIIIVCGAPNSTPTVGRSRHPLASAGSSCCGTVPRCCSVRQADSWWRNPEMTSSVW